MLENAAKIAFTRANKNAVQFDDSKSELIHFGSHKAAPEQTVILPNNTVIKPKNMHTMARSLAGSKAQFQSSCANENCCSQKNITLTI